MFGNYVHIVRLHSAQVHMEYFCLNPFKILVTLRLPNGSANSWETQCCKERGRKVLQRGGGWCCDRLWLIYEPHYTLHSDPATARATLCICPIFLQSFRLPLRGVVKESEFFLPGQVLVYMYTLNRLKTINF